MSSRQASLQRYYPYILAGVLAATAVVSYRLYAVHSRSSPRLRRSNATRRRGSPPRRHQRASTDSGPNPDPGGVLTDEQLLENLNRERESLPLGIHIPESAAEALTEAGHAAQEARGARALNNGVDGREGRAGRRDSELADSEFSFTDEPSGKENENQNLLTLLYTIAQDQAQRESFVHRGVTCNNCQIIPIRGIRYRCANCLDYDLCEVCEALDAAHYKTHIFYKIRIPAPFIGNPRDAQMPSYPGKPQMMMMSLTPDIIRRLAETTKFEQVELEALYEQFKVLAASEYDDTEFRINGAISRDTFDECFIPNTHLHPPSPNLIYDRMFNFYDTNGDGLISFGEFVHGIAITNNTKSKSPGKIKKVFQGYDLNDDGYVERRDFLRIFKSFYALSKALVKDIVGSLGDDLYEQGHMDQALYGRQPISAVFTSSIPPARRTWDKPPLAENEDGDEDQGALVIPSSGDLIGPEDLGQEYDRYSLPDKGNETERERKIENARRAEFWTAVQGDDQDLMIPDEERDVGNEVLFHMAMRGINELLDILFKEKETAAVKARFTEEEGSKEMEPEVESEVEAKAEPVGDGKEQLDGESKGLPLSTETPSKDDGTDNTANREQEPTKQKKEERQKKKDARAATIAMREEIKLRGGEGRLSYEEFERIMTGDDSGKLEFVGTWTDLASF